jgi:hypothetical protein
VVEVIACITHPLHSLTLTRAPCPVPGGTSSPWKNHLNPTSKPPSPKRHPPSPSLRDAPPRSVRPRRMNPHSIFPHVTKTLITKVRR